MGLNFNLFSISGFEANILSVTYKHAKRTFLWILLEPWYVFAIVTTITALSNKETFPAHNLLQDLKSLFGGQMLSFVLEFRNIITGLLVLWFFVACTRFINRLIEHYDYYDLPLPIYLLLQLNEQYSDTPWSLRELRLFELYIYSSALYINYLIIATPNLPKLSQIITSEHPITAFALGFPLIVLIINVFIYTARKIERFLLLSL